MSQVFASFQPFPQSLEQTFSTLKLKTASNYDVDSRLDRAQPFLLVSTRKTRQNLKQANTIQTRRERTSLDKQIYDPESGTLQRRHFFGMLPSIRRFSSIVIGQFAQNRPCKLLSRSSRDFLTSQSLNRFTKLISYTNNIYFYILLFHDKRDIDTILRHIFAKGLCKI